MKKVQSIIILCAVSVLVGCSGSIGLGRSNIEDMPEWFKNLKEYKHYAPDTRIYGKGFAENVFLQTAMSNADQRAIADLATKIATYSKQTSVIRSVSSNVRTANTGERRKKDNKDVTTRQAREYSEQVIENIASEVLRRPIEEIADHWEMKKEGIQVYRSWSLWSVSISDIERSLLEKMQEDPDFFEAIKQVYSF